MDTRRWITAHWTFQGMGLTFLSFLGFYPYALHVQEHIFFVLLFSAVGVATFQGRPVWIRNILDVPLALLVGWILLTIPFSIDPIHSFSEWRKLVAYILAFYWALLVLKHCEDWQCWRYVIGAVLAGVSTMALYALVSFLQEGGALVPRRGRAVAPSSHVSWLGAYLILSLPFVIACGVWTKTRAEKLMLTGVVCLLLLVAVFSYSRAGWLALGVMAIVFGVLRGGRTTGALTFLSVIAIASVLFGISLLGYLGGVFDSSTLGHRVEGWTLAVQSVISNPIVGVGFGHDIFQQIYPAGQTTGLVPGMGHTHNAFLMYAMGSGVPALIFLLWVFAAIVKECSQHCRFCGESGKGIWQGKLEREAVALAGILSVTGYMVTMALDNLFLGSLAYLFWKLVAVGFSLPKSP